MERNSAPLFFEGGSFWVVTSLLSDVDPAPRPGIKKGAAHLTQHMRPSGESGFRAGVLKIDFTLRNTPARKPDSRNKICEKPLVGKFQSVRKALRPKSSKEGRWHLVVTSLLSDVNQLFSPTFCTTSPETSVR